MNHASVGPCAARLLLVVSAAGLVACGGEAAGPEAPNPLGVPDTIVFAVSSAEVVIGDTARLSVVARDVGGNVVPNVVLVWRSLTPSVATVSNDGLVTALDIGEAEIEVEATVPGSSFALHVDTSQVGTTSLRRVKTRFKMYSVPKLTISPTSATVVAEDQQLFTASLTNVNNQQLINRPVTKWTSSNPAVASIDVTGLATALTKGTTTITASVTVGSSHVSKTATLTVDDALCGGIASIPTLQGTFIYDYAVGGTLSGGERVGAEYHGNVTSTMTSLGWHPGIPTVVWKGPLKGTASHLEGVFEGTKETHRVESSGAPIDAPGAGARSEAIVVVELKTCTFRVDVTVSLNLTHTNYGTKGPTLPSFSAGLWVGENKKLSTTGGASPFPIATDQEYPGHTIAYPFGHPTEDAFIVYGGYAPMLMTLNGREPGVGKADVNYSIAVVKP